MESSRHDVTEVLEAVGRGEEAAAERLLALVYEELRQMARHRMARERTGRTLQPTALVHEAYLRLFADSSPGWENRAHFFAAAAEAMRRILIDRARRRLAQKRGGQRQRVTFDEQAAVTEPPPEVMLALDEALSKLAGIDPPMARVVELRYFGGLTVAETAAALRLSPRTVDRLWTAARAWLEREIDA
jgi:RNA polymerase sigma factor (TIGR02999 family)